MEKLKNKLANATLLWIACVLFQAIIWFSTGTPDEANEAMYYNGCLCFILFMYMLHCWILLNHHKVKYGDELTESEKDPNLDHHEEDNQENQA